jgi:hypothetical protein
VLDKVEAQVTTERLTPLGGDTIMGAGGIGEVSRATDSNLARHVAINIVADSVPADAEDSPDSTARRRPPR